MRKTGKKWLAFSLVSAMVIAAAGSHVGSPHEVTAAEAANTDTVTVDFQNRYNSNDGIFEGWGTSLCWFGHRRGGSEQTSEEAAKLLCNSEEGLGLDIIRFNIGGGDDPTHDHITRTDSKMPGYWGEYDESADTFTYDFTKDANQRNVLNKMLAQNKDLVLEAFSNSPPYFMTESGCTSGTAEVDENGNGKLADNLKEDKYDDFAEYLAQVVKYYRDSYGIAFSSVEPMNENGWSIARNGQKQEGCTFTEGESRSKMILAMEEALKNNGLEDLILAGCDESSPGETITCLDKLSEDALNALERVDTQTYSTTKELNLREKVKGLSKNLWMSETDGGDTAGTKAGEMGAALALAKRIGYDMHNLQPSAWIIWQAIGSYCDTETYEGNKDPDSLDQSEMDTKGFWGVSYADMNQEKVVLTKKYYAFGQYTRYIHPGDVMLTGNAQNTIAYDKESKELKIVAVNTSDAMKAIRYDFNGFDVKNTSVEVIRTSGDMETGENWKKVDDITADSTGFDAQLSPNSITTFIVKGAETDSTAIETPAPQNTDTPAPQSTNSPAPPVPTTPADVSPSPDAAVSKTAQVKVSKISKNTAAVTWKSQTGVKYKIAYSTNKKSLAKIKDGSIKAVSGTKMVSAAKNTVTLKKLKKNTTYYVKVCAYRQVDGKTVYGQYSGVKKFKTKKK